MEYMVVKIKKTDYGQRNNQLSNNQEEVDDEIMFHINDGAKHGLQLILVDSTDTDGL